MPRRFLFVETRRVAAKQTAASRNGFVSGVLLVAHLAASLCRVKKPERPAQKPALRNSGRTRIFSAGRHPCSAAWHEAPLIRIREQHFFRWWASHFAKKIIGWHQFDAKYPGPFPGPN